jgi:hypothetical protein
MNCWLQCRLLLVLCVGSASLLGCRSVGTHGPLRQGWSDTPLGHTQALSVLQTLNADLLSCGDHVLSEADNWYLPRQLTAAMNDRLDHSDAPFGKVVQPLHFRRETLSAQLLWSPLSVDWEMTGAIPASGNGQLVVPHRLLQHRAVLRTGDNQPFSVLIETYTDQVLNFRHEMH